MTNRTKALKRALRSLSLRAERAIHRGDKFQNYVDHLRSAYATQDHIRKAETLPVAHIPSLRG